MADILNTPNMNLHVQTNASSVKNNSSHFDQEESDSNGASETKPSKKAHMEQKSREADDILNLSKDDLQLFEHQVAGHGTAEKGLLKHKLGHILKPLQGPPKGTREVNFYQKVFSSEDSQEDCYSKLREFIPKFHGLAHLQQDNVKGSGDSTNETDSFNRYLLLDDVLKGFKKPCVADLKIGSQTWSPGASEEKIKQEKSKYKGTKFSVGISLTGMLYYDVQKNFEMQKVAKEYVKGLNPTSLRETLKQFMNHERDSKSMHLSSILIKIVCEKLQKIKEIFDEQKSFRLYGSSILIAYDADFFNSGEISTNGEGNGEGLSDYSHVPISVSLIDFAHFHPGEYDTVDENYLFGLRNLMQIFCDIAENT